MEPVVILGTRSVGLSVVALKRAKAVAPSEAAFEVTTAGLTASTWAYEHPDLSSLVVFLEGLEAAWRGWQGVREWFDLENAVNIAAEHTGGQVLFKIRLRRDLDWETNSRLEVGAGEDLAHAVRSARDLFG